MHIPQKPSNLVVGILPLNVLNTSVIPRTAQFSGDRVKGVIVVTLMQGLIQESVGDSGAVLFS